MGSSFPHFWIFSLLLSVSCFSSALHLTSSSSPHVYIVYLGLSKKYEPILTTNHHHELLSNVFLRKEETKKSMLYSYRRSFSGFSAILNSTQATVLSRVKGVVSVFKSRMLKIHTTRSWDFLGLTLADISDHHQVSKPTKLGYGGEDIIVAVLDTGVWPESDSFHEEPELGPVPKSWKGKCVAGDRFDPKISCNRKLVGARFYLKGFEEEYGPLSISSKSEYRSARDLVGHGTHVASTAVGSVSRNASFIGLGKGIARGGASRARLAVYKVCWSRDFVGICSEADILAAFDQAVHDGVNVISASYGVTPPLMPFFSSSADIGSFHAMQAGISVVFSAGNDGPEPSLVQNVAPWATCVAASSIDRNFPTRVVLDNSNLSFTAESINVKQIKGRLVDASDYFIGGICRSQNWRKQAAIGKIILCFSSIGSITSGTAQVAAFVANASALIFVEPPTKQIADLDIIPTIRVNIDLGTKIFYYIVQSPKQPKVVISPSSTVIEEAVAPIVAPFSSRGPSSISPDILKPDVSAPGVNILAAWPPKASPTGLPSIDKRSLLWNFQSGTSMSCPHVSGIIALIKSVHPDWSPAAIRSALITTAYNMDKSGDIISYGGIAKGSDPFDVGAGHVDPLKALDPGLVYDIKPIDYIFYLCNIGYDEDTIAILSPDTTVTCPKGQKKTTNFNLNYPSIVVPNLEKSTVIKRTVRIVDELKTAVYFVSIVEPNGVEVSVWPRLLAFSWFKEEASYYVTLKPTKKSKERYDFGEIVWTDGFHCVRTPLVVRVNNTDSTLISKL
ncbi:subtilisin-like protease SBT3.18 [Impatiens glandulifera]|uniref:subtilisin-like protease SBT3.18 n=1 Tax=Impatiens glandulifera TaxID=253017 RepID=UPI001FB10F17|nr:subtilisin-like protease SBT3.18 [Impatiens glandulifera]